MKICKHCKQQKPLVYFSKDMNTKDGLQRWCKSCKAEQAQQYQKTFTGRLRYTFAGIKQRCNNPKNKNYYNYGGRGIECRFTSVYDFIDYVINVLEYTTLNSIKGLHLDRIDNNGHYERGNIRFVTPKISAKNRRKILSHCPHCGKNLYKNT